MIFILAWIVSFFIAFLYLQHADRQFGNDSAWSTFINLVVASIPGINLLAIVIAALYMNL